MSLYLKSKSLFFITYMYVMSYKVMTVSYHRKTSNKIKISTWTSASESFYVSVMKIRNEMHIDIKIIFLPMIKFVKQINIYFPIFTFKFLHHCVYLPLWSRNLKIPYRPTQSRRISHRWIWKIICFWSHLHKDLKFRSLTIFSNDVCIRSLYLWVYVF